MIRVAQRGTGNQCIQFHLKGGTNQQWAFVPLSDGNYLIVNQKSGKALDVWDGSMGDGAAVVQWHLDAALSQEWSVIPLSDGNYEILNANSGKALEVAAWSTSDGARIQTVVLGRGG